MPGTNVKRLNYDTRNVYFRIQADNFVFTVLDNLRAVREDANIGAELMATANSYYYGNGCLLGQSERFKAVRAAKNLVGVRAGERYSFSWKLFNKIGLEESHSLTIISNQIPLYKSSVDLLAYLAAFST